MSPEEKDAVMDDFRRGEIQVLVSTSVVEVGVDVPNATLMTIESGAAVRAGPTAPASRPDQPRQLPRLLLRLRRPADRRGAAAARGLRRHDRRLRAGRDRLPAPRPGRAVRHPAARPAAVSHRRPAARCGRCRRSPPRRPAAGRRRPGPGAGEHARLRRMMLVRYGKALELGDVG